MATLRRGGAALSAQDQADIRRDIGLGTAATAAATDFATAAQGTDAREWTSATVDQAEAEAGTATTRRAWTAQRVRQAIVAWWNGYSSAAGRTLVTAADAAAQRTAIGAAGFTTAQTTAGGTAVAALTSGGVLLDADGNPLPVGSATLAVASSRTALATDNSDTLELASGVTYTLTNAVALPQGVILMGPASGTATIAVTGSATINGGTSAIIVAANTAYTALPRAGAPAAFVVRGG